MLCVVSLQKLPAKWIGVSGVIMFVLGSGVGFYGFPALIRSQIASVSRNNEKADKNTMSLDLNYMFVEVKYS